MSIDQDILREQKRIRNADFVKPPNALKQKLGVGGLDPAVIEKAEKFIAEHTVDFGMLGAQLVQALGDGMSTAKEGGLPQEPAIEVILYPAAQLKAQGTMFHFPLVTRIAEILVSFLESVEATNDDVFEIVEAHKSALTYVLSNNLRDETSAHGRALQNTLQEACRRYYRSRRMMNEAGA
jgi:hypothetical protein